MKSLTVVGAAALSLLLFSCTTRPHFTAGGTSHVTSPSYGRTSARSTPGYDSTTSGYEITGSFGSDNCSHPPHHSIPFSSRDDERLNASHRTGSSYRDPHHGGSTHGHDAAGHRVDSHGHHVDPSGRHTNTPDVIAHAPERPVLGAAPASSEPARSAAPDPSPASAAPPPAPASEPAPASDAPSKSEPASSSGSESSPDRGRKS